MQIGVLALQGAFIEHRKMFEKLGVETFEIRNPSCLEKDMDGLVIPGGESTTMFKLLNDLGMVERIKTLIKNGLPVLGTCAGLILLANKVENYKRSFLKSMDIIALKNAYGRQLGSFKTFGEFDGVKKIPFIFIRAPYIKSVGSSVEILATHREKIVAAREKNILVTAFHPELANNTYIHEYFINIVTESKH
ncbi:MAG: pyridoxal 5'-phosphate synthase glutaminase subunit PdxT [Candidatus Izimaplasma sp.]|nr:pyridoxal 5'-phosphate synthase glutaminase subunit PdxT [Candidatus Izimaplasma bacterium]